MKVGATLGDAIAQWANRGVAYGDVWPLRLFEGSVMPADVLSTEEHAMRVRALVVEREVPLREAFGPRTEDLVRLIDSMDGTRWLRPDGRAGSVARIAELIAEHYAALLDYGPVTARPARVVRTWHEARDLYSTVEVRAEAATAAIQAACVVNGGSETYIAAQIAESKLARSAFCGVWSASWLEAARSATTGIHALPLVGQIVGSNRHDGIATASRAVDGLVKALGAAREPAWRAGWNAAYQMFNGVPDEVTDPEILYAEAVDAARMAFARNVPARPLHALDCETCASAPDLRDAIATVFITHTCSMVWTVAMKAAQLASCRGSYLVNALPQADPWRPLSEIWQLGGCPLGASKSAFLVFLPEPKS